MPKGRNINMDFSEKEIKRLFPIYVKKHKDQIKYFKGAQEVTPTSVEKCVVLNLQPGKFGGDCNYHLTLDLGDVFINGMGTRMTGDAYISVGFDVIDSEVVEKINSMQDNRINIKKLH